MDPETSVTSLTERTRKRSQGSEWNYSKKPEEHAIEQQRISVKLLTKFKNSNIFLNRWLNSFQTSATPFIHSIQLNVLQSTCKGISKLFIHWQIINKIEEKKNTGKILNILQELQAKSTRWILGQPFSYRLLNKPEQNERNRPTELSDKTESTCNGTVRSLQ